MKDIRVLLYLDDPELTEMLNTILKFYNFKVSEVKTQKEVINELKQKKDNVLILSYVMGGLNGLEVGQTIRTQLQLRKLNIVLLTYKDFNNEELRSISTNELVYLKRPVLPNELAQKIESLFS